MLPSINGEFRIVADPELRFTPSGKAVASARIVANSRKKTDSGEWVDDKVCWLNLSIWDKPAENFVETFEKGDLVVILNGRLETREYETREGEKRTSLDVTATDFGPSLRFASAKITKTARSSGEGQTGTAASSSGGTTAPAEDPWATPQSDEPPF
jgi:single-strand DNA-binding protein